MRDAWHGGFGAGACLVVLDACACLGASALLPHLAPEFGLGETEAAALLSAPFYLGRLLGVLSAPALIARVGGQRLVGGGALALALSAGMLAKVGTVTGLVFARFCAGASAGPALVATFAIFPSPLPAAARRLHELQLAAILGALLAQAPFSQLVSTYGWRRATVFALCAPAVGVCLAEAWVMVHTHGERRTAPLLTACAPRRVASYPSAISQAAPENRGKLRTGCGVLDLLSVSREPHLLLLACVAFAPGAVLEQLGGSFGFMALERGYGVPEYGWNTSNALLGTSLVFVLGLAAISTQVFSSQPRSPKKHCTLAAAHCVCLALAVATLLAVPARVPDLIGGPRWFTLSDTTRFHNEYILGRLSAGVVTMGGLALAGTAAAGALPLSQLLLESSRPRQRPTALVLGSATSAFIGCFLSLALPVMFGSPENAASMSPLVLLALLFIAVGAAAASLTLRIRMVAPEMLEHILILSLESGDELREAEEDENNRLLGLVAERYRPGLRFALLPSGPPVNKHVEGLSGLSESACDVRQKGSVESDLAVYKKTNRDAPPSPPKPYPVDKLIAAQSTACNIFYKSNDGPLRKL
mmetsp:Transcript_39714/g.98194  ORF Transcript_39714/g.98194 Transcript_39714/m.98194 type:complete len:587 (-) Transcript_39714:83-1843(-)